MEKSASESSGQQLLDFWFETYKGTVGRFWETPAVGPAREQSEKMMKGFSVFVDLYGAWIGSNINMQPVFMEAMRRTQEKAMDAVTSENIPPSQKDYYKMWVEAYSDTFADFLKSGHFAADMGKFMSHSMEAQQFSREMLEENYLKPMNLPTKTEIDEINKELYSLKKAAKEANRKTADVPAMADIDEINEELRSLNKELRSLKTSVKEANERAADLPKMTDIKKIDKEVDALKEKAKELTGQIKKLSAKK